MLLNVLDALMPNASLVFIIEQDNAGI